MLCTCFPWTVERVHIVLYLLVFKSTEFFLIQCFFGTVPLVCRLHNYVLVCDLLHCGSRSWGPEWQISTLKYAVNFCSDWVDLFYIDPFNHTTAFPPQNSFVTFQPCTSGRKWIDHDNSTVVPDSLCASRRQANLALPLNYDGRANFCSASVVNELNMPWISVLIGLIGLTSRTFLILDFCWFTWNCVYITLVEVLTAQCKITPLLSNFECNPAYMGRLAFC